MTGLGIRSGSYGSLDKQHLQNGGGLLPIQQTPPRSKPSKMFKEKEGLVHWICKFAGRKKVGMLLLCVISAAVFIWVLYVGKGLLLSLNVLGCSDLDNWSIVMLRCSFSWSFRRGALGKVCLICVFSWLELSCCGLWIRTMLVFGHV